MSTVTATATARAAPPPPAGNSAATLAKVEPQLRELSGLARAAATLPSWARLLRARHSGQYLSRVRGRGMEYDESRPYQPGDDIRQLDWRVTARTGRAHTKLFREERERPLFIGVDYSRSMFFATRGVFKAVQAARLAALLAWRAQQNGDRVGGLVFSPAAHHELPPRRGTGAVMRWLKLLADEAPGCRLAPPAAATALGPALVRLQRIAKPGSLIFLVSDFSAFDDESAAALARLAQHTDLALLQVYDPFEAAFPTSVSGGPVSDDRDTLHLHDVSDAQRESYAAGFEQQQARVRQLCREQRLGFAAVATDDDPVGALIRQLAP